MTSEKHYPNAPITEAVIDIQLTSQVSSDQLAKVNDGQGDYPTSDQLNATSGAMLFGPSANTFTTSTSQPIGFISRSNDNLHIYQARTNGFTFSRLAPYPHWSVLRSEARKLWKPYRDLVKPTSITRVALRYVNRIDIPLPVNDFADYLRTHPVVSSELPQGLFGYFMQLVLPLPEIKGTAIINQTIIPPHVPNVVSIVLDIDINRMTDIPQDDDSLWLLFEQLRNTKNHVFEACITDKTRSLFQ